MNNLYIRITNEWSLVLEPREDRKFLINGSGNTIQVYTTKNLLSDLSEITHPFTVGGSISSLSVAASEYVYCRADVDIAEEAILTISDERIASDDRTMINENLDRLITQVMHLSNRTMELEAHRAYHELDYAAFLRKFMHNTALTNNYIASLQNQILGVQLRLFDAEMYVFNHRSEYLDIKFRVENIESGKSTGDDDLIRQVTETMTTVNNLNSKLNEILPRIEEAWSDYDTMVKEHLVPLKEDVAEIRAEFAYLNNAFVKLTAEHTPAEIEEVFETIIGESPADTIDVTIGLKNVLVELSTASHTNLEQDKELETKLDETDDFVFSSDAEFLNDLIIE